MKPLLPSCRSVESYKKLNKIQEGTYGIVYRAQHRETSKIFALKKLKLEGEKEGFPITSLREINALMHVEHPNIVKIHEIVVGRELSSVFIVMEYVEHDLRSLMNDMTHPFSMSEIKRLMIQLISATAICHSQWIVHRDLKTSNLLLSNDGQLKVADFGLARKLSEPRQGKLTPIVVTLWYRAPELLLGAKDYSWAIDMWSIGCIFAEFLNLGRPIFTGKSEIDQLDQIFRLLGTPNNEVWPSFSQLPHASKIKPLYGENLLSKTFTKLSDLGLDLLRRLLTLDPDMRISADDALLHPWFKEYPLPKDPCLFPTWPSTNIRHHLSDHDRSSPSPRSIGKRKFRVE